MSRSDYQPHWVAFADSRGVQPWSKTLKNWEFMAWISQQKTEFFASLGRPVPGLASPEDLSAFSSWLCAEVRRAA